MSDDRYYSWDPKFEAENGVPTAILYLVNVLARPVGDGTLELRIKDHPQHAQAVDALYEHFIGREVVLILDKQEYYYRADVGPDNEFLLSPMDGFNEKLPDDRRFLETAFNLRVRY